MVLDHHWADHVHVADAADDRQTDHDQQPGHSTPFHAQGDRRHGVAVHQRTVVNRRRAHHRFDDGRGRLVDENVGSVVVVQHSLRKNNETIAITKLLKRTSLVGPVVTA